MPTTKKSSIRSRWYRPNEKPLESSNQIENDQPFGEILIRQNSKFIDDLSAIKPSPVQNKVGGRTGSSGKAPSKNKNRERNQKRKSRPRNDESENRDTNIKRRPRPKSNHKRNSQNRESEGPKSKERNKKKIYSKNQSQKKQDEKTSTKSDSSKLSYFIAKFFGN